MSRKKKILAVCPTSWERAAMASPALHERYEFIECGQELEHEATLWRAVRFDVFKYLGDIAREHRYSRLNGVLGTGDYPGCMFSAWLAHELGLPGPSPRAVVRLSHKVHSRVVQSKVVPEATPPFEMLRQSAAVGPTRLSYPFFVKPVKGTMSIRARMVEDPAALKEALALTWREKLRAWVLLRPFLQMLRHYGDADSQVWDFVAEGPLKGVQVTVDGFVQGGRVTIMGIVDSIMYPGTMSFQRFEYPSSLPAGVLDRMADITRRFVQASGLDHTCFNVELFYDEEADHVSIIELNPRMSYQFSDLFEKVDGTGSFDVQLLLATGQPVEWRPGAGPDGAAASFVERRFSDGRVRRAPGVAELEEIARRFPGAHVQVLAHEGERLSEHDQDVGSFRYCITNLSAPTRERLHADYAELKTLLTFEFD